MRVWTTLVLLVCIVFSQGALALSDELEVHLDDTTPKGHFAADVITNYTASGPRVPNTEGLRPTVHLLQISPDFSYGLTSNSQIGLQLFSSFGPHSDSSVDGGRIEYMTIPIRPDDEDDDGPFLGGLVEVGHLPPTLSKNKLDGEIKVLTGYRGGRWIFAANPEIGFKVKGDGSSKPDLGIKFKAAYRVEETYSVGIEHYGDLGQVGRIGPLNRQSQQTFAVLDIKTKGMDFNIGIGHGWNDFSERWVAKAIISYPFGE